MTVVKLKRLNLLFKLNTIIIKMYNIMHFKVLRIDNILTVIIMIILFNKIHLNEIKIKNI